MIAHRTFEHCCGFIGLFAVAVVAYFAGGMNYARLHQDKMPEKLRIMSTHTSGGTRLRREFVGYLQPDSSYKIDDALCPTLRVRVW